MPTNSLDINWANKLLDSICTLDSDSTIEVGVHPGTDEKWREQEYKDILCFSTLLKETDHDLINWKKCMNLQIINLL